MATWHQMQRPVRLWHETMWTVVVDPPHRPLGLMLFETEAEAKQYAANVQHAYVLRPARECE